MALTPKQSWQSRKAAYLINSINHLKVEKTVNLGGTVLILSYCFSPNIPQRSIDAYLNRETEDKDESRHPLHLDMASIKLLPVKWDKQPCMVLDSAVAQNLCNEILKLEAEANKDYVVFDTYASEYYC